MQTAHVHDNGGGLEAFERIPTGSTSIDRDSEGTRPLRPGRYPVYLLVDDGYRAVAGADFTVE